MYKRRNKSVSAFTDKQREQQQQQQIARTRWKATSDRKKRTMFGHHERNKQQPNNFSLSASLKKRENARAWRMTKHKENFGEKRKKRGACPLRWFSPFIFKLSKKRQFSFSGSPVASNQDGQSSFFFGRQEFANHKQCSSKHSSPGCWLAYATTEKWCLATDEFE